MAWVPGGTFRMGSDQHYQEERPAHDVAVDGQDAGDFGGDLLVEIDQCRR